MKITRVFSQEIENEMNQIGFDLFDAVLTDTTIIARDEAGQIVAFLQDEDDTIYEIESYQKGAGRLIVEWLKGQVDFIEVENSGKDSWGFWEKMGFSQTASGEYYGKFEWEF